VRPFRREREGAAWPEAIGLPATARTPLRALLCSTTSEAKRSFNALRLAAHNNATDRTATPITIAPWASAKALPEPGGRVCQIS
jgi:hypothetical protein